MKNLNPSKSVIKENQLFYNKFCYLLLSFHAGISTISDLAVQYFFKDTLQLQPGSMSQISSISMIPWILKPLFGLLTDTCPIFGYRRKYYILMCGFLDISCWLFMAFYAHSIFTATILLLIINICLAFSTVLSEAIVVELSRIGEDGQSTKSTSAKDYISMFFIVKDIGALASSYLKGYFIDIMSIRSIFLISACTPIMIIIAGLMVVESKKTLNPQGTAADEKDKEVPENDVVVLIGADINEENNKLLKGNTNNSQDTISHCNDNVNSSSASSVWKFVSQSIIVVPMLFIIAYMATPAYDDPLFYYLTNHLHFNGNIMGQMSFISALTATLAIIAYKLFFKSVGFKKMLIFGTLLYFTFSFSAYLLVTDLYKNLGVSPYFMALFSSGTTSMLGEFVMMPMLSLACLLCPPNYEATVYSLFMSAINFGSILSYLEGSYITAKLGITSNNFKNLPKMILISNFVGLLPLFILCFVDDEYFNPTDETKIENEKFDK